MRGVCRKAAGLPFPVCLCLPPTLTIKCLSLVNRFRTFGTDALVVNGQIVPNALRVAKKEY